MNKTYLAVIVLVAAVGVSATFSYSSSRATTTQSQSRPFDLVVQNRRLVSGPSTLTVNQGDSVTIRITADEDEELHLHGYNLHIDLEKGKPGALSFIASTSGRFPYELERNAREIGALEVQPR